MAGWGRFWQDGEWTLVECGVYNLAGRGWLWQAGVDRVVPGIEFYRQLLSQSSGDRVNKITFFLPPQLNLFHPNHHPFLYPFSFFFPRVSSWHGGNINWYGAQRVTPKLFMKPNTKRKYSSVARYPEIYTFFDTWREKFAFKISNSDRFPNLVNDLMEEINWILWREIYPQRDVIWDVKSHSRKNYSVPASFSRNRETQTEPKFGSHLLCIFYK